MKRGQMIKVIKTGQVLRITRVDKHVYPICAGYARYALKEVEPA